ncbi:hypothetical protein [Streptomyces sp. NPDC058653]|uniref:hypothetical protein n=1 Tax=Streptomyces sp. NPDC058653 TaxID=3346576 RepID=UPI0036570F9C
MARPANHAELFKAAVDARKEFFADQNRTTHHALTVTENRAVMAGYSWQEIVDAAK